MDSATTTAMVAGAAGVLGALAGGGALLRSSRNDRRAHERRDHDAALVELYTAAMSLGLTYEIWSSMQPKSKYRLVRAIEHTRLALKIVGYPTRVFLDRIVGGADRMWQAVGLALAVASPDERSVVKSVESAFADWQLPRPMPATWAPAIRELRGLLESLSILPRP